MSPATSNKYEPELARLVEAISGKVAPFKFKAKKSAPNKGLLHSWQRLTPLSNRGIALVEFPGTGVELTPFCRGKKWSLAGHYFAIPVLRGVGLQMIVVGENLLRFQDTLAKAVNRIDNQVIIIQSIFAIDLEAKKFISARTWGQILTFEYQNAIRDGISTCYESAGPEDWI